MTLPDFDDQGRLPAAVSPYAATLDEIRERFVHNATHARSQRKRLFRALEMHLDLVRRNLGRGIKVWIDGGFLTDKGWPPNDIDVAYVMPEDRYKEVAQPEHAALWTMLKVSAHQPRLVDAPKVQPMGGLVDAFPVLDVEPQIGYWTEQWSGVTDRNGERIEGARKGFVEVML